MPLKSNIRVLKPENPLEHLCPREGIVATILGLDVLVFAAIGVVVQQGANIYAARD